MEDTGLETKTSPRDSILTSIKMMLGIAEEMTAFDEILILHINSCFSVLNGLGVGPSKFSVQSKDDLWSDFIEDEEFIAEYKSYLYMKVRLLFDPPQSGPLVDAMNKLISEFEWRLLVETNHGEETEDDGGEED